MRGAPGRDAGQVRVGRVRVGLSPLPGPLPVLLPDPLPVLLPVLLSGPLPVLLPGPLPGRWLSARGNSPFPRPDGTSPAAGRAWPRGGVRRSAAWLFFLLLLLFFLFLFFLLFFPVVFFFSPLGLFSHFISFRFLFAKVERRGWGWWWGGGSSQPTPAPSFAQL